ncbi:MAG: glycosyltransferase, partial [archaeon]
MIKKIISIVIPAYNEEKTLPVSIKKIQNFIKTSYIKRFYDFEIIIVEDKSTDNTFKKAKKIERKYNNIKVMKNKKNKGKGYTVK